ncbi:WXG100-like domain-containing protein, partial [Pseudonocardia nigra]|uniref:WXG100-like domain-containing protein n=1 Tax=Pseudonocardia nigra TaxID=1921578 RepID=UPI003FD736F2
MSSPLTVEPEHEDAQPLNWEGAGAASSWADLNKALAADQVDPVQVAFAAAGAGLDTLGAVAWPLDSLLEAGFGWLIEHVWFLHEPLDALAGDPTQITAQAQTWHNVGVELGEIAAEHRAQAAALPGWEGAAGDAYRTAVTGLTGATDRTAADADQLAQLILTTGALVGTERALIRDLIAEFAAKAVQVAIGYGLAALVTAGGALGYLAIRIIVSALELAETIARRISDLLDALAAAGGTAAQLSEAIRDTAAQVRAAAPGLRAAA